MPRTADHHARRTQICDGVRQVALERGLGGVTVSGAARAAGVSVGLVQHYYESKEALLVDTLEHVLAGILARVERATRLAETQHSRIEHMLGAGLEQLLPLDAARREEARLRVAFIGLALDNEKLRLHQARFVAALRRRTARAIANAFECGEIPDPRIIDPDLEAHALLSLVDGLCTQLLTAPAPDDEHRARTVIATRMQTLFPGPCSRPAMPRDS